MPSPVSLTARREAAHLNLDITFGQYCEGNSLLHRMDPRAKILAAILYIVIIFLAKNLFAFGLLLLSAIVLIAVSGVPFRIVLKGMKALTVIILFTAAINIFWLQGETLLVSFWIINIYLEGILNAVMIAVRIIILLVVTSLFLTYTTTPIALTDGLEQLLAPLKVLHIPVHEFSMMMTIALRFIPTLVEETQKIMNAQKARGADFSTGSLLQRARALVPILVPLFISAFRRAEELATAMECRCYTGGDGRTRMNVLHASARDFSVCIGIVVLGAGVILLNRLSVYGLSW